MTGLRFIICATDKEIKAVTDYLKGAGRKCIVTEKQDFSQLSDSIPAIDLTLIWYIGSDLDQRKLVELTNGLTLF